MDTIAKRAEEMIQGLDPTSKEWRDTLVTLLREAGMSEATSLALAVWAQRVEIERPTDERWSSLIGMLGHAVKDDKNHESML